MSSRPSSYSSSVLWASPPTVTPSLPYHTAKASPSDPSFSTNLASSQPPLQAQYLRVLSPSVDQNPGASFQTASPPASTVPATRPCSRASPQSCFFSELCTGPDPSREQYGLAGDGLSARDSDLEPLVSTLDALDVGPHTEIH